MLDSVKTATQAAYADPDDYAAFLADHLQIAARIAQRAVARERDAVCLDGELDLVGLRELIELQAKLAAVPSSLDLEDVVDLRFMHERRRAALARASTS